jgi:dolichol-phosphate mannosyltransferase/undecaprenyl-phosphate 4-deoxy-4-formamido-L-arabinose transferase
MTKPLFSVVVPVYRSERSLPELHERIERTFVAMGRPYELVLVEDCGGDRSWEVMRSLRERDERVKIVRLARNFGQHNAVLCGLSIATGEFVITMDDDLQNPPEEIPRLIEAIEDEPLDVVYGIPRGKKPSFIRRAGSRIFLRLVGRIFGEPADGGMSSFRILRRHAVEQVLRISTPNPLIGLLLLHVTDRVGTIPVDHFERQYGGTTYTAAKLVRHFLSGILYHSVLPLKAVFALGLASMGVAFLLGVYYLASYLMGGITVSGWTTLVLLVLFFSGTVMFSLGIIGEYLLRIIQEVRRLPQYVIREKDV